MTITRDNQTSMGHASMIGRQGVVGLLALVTAAGVSVSGQTSLLDRRVGADFLGAPIVWVPDGITSGLVARRVAQGAEVPVLFEAVAVNLPAAGETQRRLDLTGLTVRDALDALVAADPRYAWREVQGAIAIRPTTAWEARTRLLDRVVPAIRADDAEVEDAVQEAIGQAVGATSPSTRATRATPGARRRVAVRAGAESALDRLGRLAAAHGALVLQLTDGGPVDGLAVEVQTFDGHTHSLSAKPEPAR